MRIRSLSSVVSAVAVAFMLALGPVSAWAHAHLDTATPQPGGSVQTAPSQVVINFTEELEPKFSSIEVDDSSGARVDRGNVQVASDNAKSMSVGLKSLPAGTYKVIWKAMATDSHKTHGTYTFKVAG